MRIFKNLGLFVIYLNWLVKLINVVILGVVLREYSYLIKVGVLDRGEKFKVDIVKY